MPALRTYRIFISHAWHRSEQYSRIVDWLNEAPNFRWENLSVPEHDPLETDELQKELRNQMREADVFLIIGGMYAAHSDWIEFELAFARRIGHPIIGIAPRASTLMPTAIQVAADHIVGWSGSSIIDAIRHYASPSG